MSSQLVHNFGISSAIVLAFDLGLYLKISYEHVQGRENLFCYTVCSWTNSHVCWNKLSYVHVPQDITHVPECVQMSW
jgi:hypothetical protein